jgi:hypothetical protein
MCRHCEAEVMKEIRSMEDALARLRRIAREVLAADVALDTGFSDEAFAKGADQQLARALDALREALKGERP